MNFVSTSLDETQKRAQEFVHSLEKNVEKATVVGLSGDLGAGKTTFVQSVAKVLGVKDTVTSPTYVIEKIYKLEDSIYEYEHLIHIDAYRLEKSEELRHLGWSDLVSNPKNLIMIEWPEKVADLIPGEARMIKFEFVDEHTREIDY